MSPFEVVYPLACLNALFVFYVSVQPNDTDIQIGGVDRNFTKGEKVTVSCTVNRLYPKITSVGSFTITWGDDANTTKEYDSIGTDKAFKYAVTITKTLNITDDGTTVECDLQPEIGTAVHLEKTVIVQCKYKVLMVGRLQAGS